MQGTWPTSVLFVTAFVTAGAALALPVHARNVADPGFDSTVAHPAFERGQGPRILVDEGHRNFHTATGRYRPAAEVLRNDGFRVGTHEGAFTAQSLQAADILLVASAIEPSIVPEDPDTWRLPVESAFTDAEIDAVADWVRDGGSLLLVVDYMPVAGMSADLAAAFGVHVADGYAYDAAGSNQITFTRAAGTLRSHPVTDGGSAGERVDAFRTFAGAPLLGPYGSEPLLLFDGPAYVVLPETLLPPDTPPPADAPRHSIDGWSQGVVLEAGAGRVAIFGEAGAFTAQRFPNGAAMGMNHPEAPQNKRLLLNLARWLAGRGAADPRRSPNR